MEYKPEYVWKKPPKLSVSHWISDTKYNIVSPCDAGYNLLKTIKNFPFELPVSDDSGWNPHFHNCKFINGQIIFRPDTVVG